MRGCMWRNYRAMGMSWISKYRKITGLYKKLSNPTKSNLSRKNIAERENNSDSAWLISNIQIFTIVT